VQRGFGFAGEFSDVHEDVVLTPPAIAEAMVRHFAPTGRVLDPCKGDGAFYKHLPGAEYCELQEGKDFFEYSASVDWIIGNPPYSVYSEWLAHSMTLADNIVYLIPINKAFNSSSMLKATYDWGGIAEIVHVGPGSKLKFPVGFAVGAVHYKRGHAGAIVYRHQFPAVC
jgi:hypothetical protein